MYWGVCSMYSTVNVIARLFFSKNKVRSSYQAKRLAQGGCLLESCRRLASSRIVQRVHRRLSPGGCGSWRLLYRLLLKLRRGDI